MYMIGRKVFSKANNSNANFSAGANPLGDAIISSGPATPPPVPHIPNYQAPTPDAGTQPAPAQAKEPKKISPALVAIISVLATALVGVVVYFVFLAPRTESDGETRDIIYASPDNDGSKTTEETIAEFDKQISATTDDDVELGLTLNKVGYYMLVDDYDSALETLNSINVSGLDDFDQYRVYNHYASVYEGLGNSTKAAEYRQLAENANSRDFNSAESGAI